MRHEADNTLIARGLANRRVYCNEMAEHDGLTIKG
jgi:hypothetical protein